MERSAAGRACVKMGVNSVRSASSFGERVAAIQPKGFKRIHAERSDEPAESRKTPLSDRIAIAGARSGTERMPLVPGTEALRKALLPQSNT